MNKDFENILKNNTNINAEINKHWEKESELKQKEVEAIHDMLTAMGGEVEIDFDCDDYPCVIYDGGNHSEYASTINGVFSKIRAITERGFKMFEVDFDDEPHYDSSRFNLCDIDSIFDYISGKFNCYLDKHNE